MSEPASAVERERVDVSAGMTPAGLRVRAAVEWLRPRWAIAAVLLAFAATMFVVPVMTPVATTDDWAYARSAEILLHDHVLRVFPVVAATAVFPVVWGALFGALFGASFGVFRLSTVVIAALGGWALYGLCRELGVSRGRAALGAAAYLFDPLAFVLAFTFMTDPFFTAALTAATWCSVKGLGGRNGDRWLVAGSGAAALALLTRQQGVLIPVAIAAFLLITGRLRPDRAGLATLLRIGALPVAAGAGYLLWLRFVNDVPSVQQSFLREAAAEGWGGTWWLLQRLTFAELAYLGLFALPIAVAALPAGRRLLTRVSGRGWLVFALWEGVLLLGVGAAWAHGRRMPYISQFFGSGGLGPSDVLGSRPHLFDANALGWLTVVCVGASLLLALLAARGSAAPPPSRRAKAGLALAIWLGQVVGVLPPSYHYIGWTAGSLDRYLLPLLPFAIALSLWAARGVRLTLPLGWLAVALLACFSIAGTRDYLVFMGAVWNMARTANAAGVSNERLDAGSAWDGYHLYEESLAGHIAPRALTKGPWWVYFYAPATDSSYVVATAPQPGYVVAMTRPYPAWLARGPTRLYLLRRLWSPWPARPSR